jgi:hypothetical protein
MFCEERKKETGIDPQEYTGQGMPKLSREYLNLCGEMTKPAKMQKSFRLLM